MRTRIALAGLAAVAAAGLTGCSGSGSGGAHAASTPAPTVSTRSGPSTSAPAGSGSTTPASALITIKNFGYQLSGPVQPGQTVVVMNKDSVSHTVTADSGNTFNVNVSPSGKATFTAPRTAGTYPFHCTYHATMHGKLVVT